MSPVNLLACPIENLTVICNYLPVVDQKAVFCTSKKLKKAVINLRLEKYENLKDLMFMCCDYNECRIKFEATPLFTHIFKNSINRLSPEEKYDKILQYLNKYNMKFSHDGKSSSLPVINFISTHLLKVSSGQEALDLLLSFGFPVKDSAKGSINLFGHFLESIYWERHQDISTFCRSLIEAGTRASDCQSVVQQKRPASATSQVLIQFAKLFDDLEQFLKIFEDRK